MEQNFKRIADSVRLPDGSRTRIRAQIASHREKQEASIMKTKKHLPRLAIALIVALALSLTAAAAVYVFRNSILVSDKSDIPEPQGDTPVAVSFPNGDVPYSLEDVTEALRITADEWKNGEKIGGGGSGWDSAEVLSSDAALSIRRITREDGAEKMEYMAENPNDLVPFLNDKFALELTWMNENYRFVPETGIAYVVRDPGGAFTGNYFSALYGAADGKGYISFELRYDTSWENSNQSYIVDSSYEEAYYYTTQSGCEFLITADSGHVWAECCTAHANVSLSGAYLTTDAVEQIVSLLFPDGHLGLYHNTLQYNAVHKAFRLCGAQRWEDAIEALRTARRHAEAMTKLCADFGGRKFRCTAKLFDMLEVDVPVPETGVTDLDNFLRCLDNNRCFDPLRGRADFQSLASPRCGS